MEMSGAKREQYWKRENPTADYIPYSVHVDKNTVKSKNGEYIQTIRMGGISHESADAEDIEVRKDQLNILYKNIASPDIAIWTHVIRREQNTYPGGEYPPGFANELDMKYQAHLQKKKMMVNELYLTIIFKPHITNSSNTKKQDQKAQEERQLDDLEYIHDITSRVMSSVSEAYDPHQLEVYEEDGKFYSEVLEFLALLVNGEWHKWPLTRNPIDEVLAVNRAFFGHETMEIRTPTESLYGGILTIKEYPETTEPGMLNALLEAPFPFVLTQSFTFKIRAVAIELLVRQRGRMVNAGDLAESQIDAIEDALDDLSAGRFAMGDHHQSLTIYGETKKELKQNISDARNALSDSGIIVGREDLALEAAYWAQLPGNFKYRPRPAPITTKNFAGLSSFHNYPTGRLEHNQWGIATTMFRTTSGAPFYFNFHQALDTAKLKQDKAEEGEKEQQKALGNTMLIGPSGSGKTVVQTFLAAQAQKYNPTCVVFDLGYGQEIFIRAMGGTYLPLMKGVPTGFNPFQMEATPENIHFLETWVRKLGAGEKGELSVQEGREISNAVNAVMNELSPGARRLSSVLAYLDSTDPEGVMARLQRWCEVNDTGKSGSLSWVFDNKVDNLDFKDKRLFGFDVTSFLDDPEIRTPIVMYLFHRMEQELIDGRRFMAFLDEFWKLLEDPYFEEFTNQKLKTIRKQDGLFVLGTQSARDVLQSPIAHSIVEQTATMIFLPNPKANEEDYVKGFNLSHREYQIIREEMPEGSRKFLIKQGHNSVVAELNLQGFNNELAILSGNEETVRQVRQIIKEVGDDPKVWIPEFQKQRA